jgi:hypothetical protein
MSQRDDDIASTAWVPCGGGGEYTSWSKKRYPMTKAEYEKYLEEREIVQGEEPPPSYCLYFSRWKLGDAR